MPLEKKYECQNCSFTGVEDEFTEAKDLSMRHEIGDAFSNIECPKCGALAFPVSDVVEDIGKLCDQMRRISEKWDERLDEGYPSFLPSFDEAIQGITVWYATQRDLQKKEEVKE